MQERWGQAQETARPLGVGIQLTSQNPVTGRLAKIEKHEAVEWSRSQRTEGRREMPTL